MGSLIHVAVSGTFDCPLELRLSLRQLVAVVIEDLWRYRRPVVVLKSRGIANEMEVIG